jgi:hypothetical protein
MKSPTVSLVLRERLGEDGTRSLHDYVVSCGEIWKGDVITACNERIDVRIERFALREDVIKGFAEIRQEMSALRVELVRWSFAFWITNLVTMAGLVSLLFRLLPPR